MKHSVHPITNDDRESVVDLLNYYVENSFAAFPDRRVPYEVFDKLMDLASGLPTAAIKDGGGKLIGFGLLKRTKPLSTFSHTAEITYFISPEHTRLGLGRILLDFLESEGRERGVGTILAEISSLNEASLNVHRRNGFVECGQFRKVGKKNGRYFDTVWMQKML